MIESVPDGVASAEGSVAEAPLKGRALQDAGVGRTEAASLLRNEADLASRYVDTVEIVVLTLDLEARIMLASRYAHTVLGWPVGELLGRNYIETCVPARFRDRSRKAFQVALAGAPTVAENFILRRSGEEVLFEWRTTPVRDDAGRVIGVFGTGTDITERARATQNLKIEEERMRFALEAASIGIWDMDVAAGTARWTELLEAQFGMQPGTFDGTFESFVERVHPEDREALVTTVGQAMKSGDDFSIQYRAIWPDGTARWLHNAGRVHLSEHGEPLRAIGISQDVTERRRLEEEHQQAHEAEAKMLQERNVALESARVAAELTVSQLKEVEQLKQEFLSTVSHELRTPLTSIRGSLGLLASGAVGELPGESVEIVAIAERNAIRLIALINDLLDLERLETGKTELAFGLVSVQSVLRRAVESVGAFAREHGVTIETPEVSSTIWADADRIVQVLVNLLSNAAKFSKPDGIVTIGIKAGVGEVEFRVTDRGRGVPATHHTVIFDRFRQVEASDAREKGGTGLGLAICKSIVEQHGGTIGVESEPGVGSTFWFRVATLRPTTQHLGRAILICNDNAERRGSLEQVISHGGYTVITVPDADAAWAVLQRGDVAVVVLEGQSTLLARIRKEPALEAVPVILFGSPLVVSPEALSDSLVLFLPQHIDDSELLAAIRHGLERGRTAAQARYVLLVEDDPALLEVMTRQLTREGIAVRTATTGKEAIRVAEAQPPALMVLDVGLPELDGFDVVDTMRQRPDLRNIPVLVYTGRDLVEEQRGRLRLGPTRFLTKSKASDEHFRRLVVELRQIPAGGADTAGRS